MELFKDVQVFWSKEADKIKNKSPTQDEVQTLFGHIELQTTTF